MFRAINSILRVTSRLKKGTDPLRASTFHSDHHALLGIGPLVQRAGKASRQNRAAWAACGLILAVLGCEAAPNAEFKLRDATNDLLPPAKTAVAKTLEENFGSPSHLVGWDRLPVSYGGVKGAVTSADGQAVVVTLDDKSAAIKSGSPILWISGALSGEKAAASTVSSFNAETGQLSLSGAGATPATGDKFVIGFGESLQLGRQVYMKNCLHCHGVTGDGNGPTGEFLNPRPRDYRNGTFKFTSTKSGEKITRDDLSRIIKYGIPGTYMPSFLLLGEKNTAAVIEYVRWLAIRGEFEKRLDSELTSDYSQKALEEAASKAKATFDEKKKNKEEAEKPASLRTLKKDAETQFAKFVKEDFPGTIDETATFLAEAWARAEESETVVYPSIPRVEDTPESRERGRLLYLSDKTKCYTCHGYTGRGDGGATEDFWPKPGSTEKYANRGLHDEWGNQLKPRNLTLGQYRGGRRPVDIFRRVYAGIKGTPMPAFGGTALKDNEIWDLVNYVMSLPYTARQPSAAPAPKEHVAKVESQPEK